jgi:integrase
MFLALLAGTGLRAGEAMGIEIDKHISADFKTLYIRQKIRRAKLENFLKTDAGRREVDLCPVLATMLREFVGERTSGFLFRNRLGNFLSQTNLLRRGLHPALKKLEQPKAGFHAFRRFRTTWLHKNRAPEDLIRFWLGHADETVTDGYSKLCCEAEPDKSTPPLRTDFAATLAEPRIVAFGISLGVSQMIVSSRGRSNA